MPQPLQLRRTFGGGDALQSGDAFTFLRYYPESLPTLAGRMTAEPNTLVDPGTEPRGYDEVRVTWGEVEIPSEVDGVALVRSCFGHATHPDDGQMLMFVRVDLDAEATSEYSGLDLLPDHLVDRSVVAGRWYYYTFMTHSAAGWRSQYTASTVVPVDYRHRETLRDLVPPYYLRLDEEQWAGTSNSVLDRFLYVLGYELDMTRTLAEGIQEVWNPDTSPNQLLTALGEQNLGIGSSELLGDLRFRGVFSDSLMINEMRGTVDGLRRFVQAASKYATDVTLGVNDLLLVDDAEFLTGTGHWAPAPYAVTTEVSGGDPLPTHRVSVTLSDKRPPAGDGTNAYPNWVRGVAKVSATTPDGEAEQQVVLACGAGQRHEVVAKDADGNETTDFLHMNPGLNGIGVEPGDAYHVSAHFRKDEAGDDPSYVVVGMVFFGQDDHESYAFSDAFSTAFDGYSTMPSVGVAPADWDALPADELDTVEWVRFEREAVVPEGAKYLVPVVRIASGQTVDPEQAPPASPVHMTAVTVTRSQGDNLTSVYVPGSTMVLGRDELNTAIIGG